MELAEEYVVTRIDPLHNTWNKHHRHVVGRNCKIENLKVGHRCRLFILAPYYEHENFHYLTSLVEDIQTDEDGILSITTMNTLYELKPVIIKQDGWNEKMGMELFKK